MAEDGVESSLQIYKAQLEQVNAALLVQTSGPEVEELMQLRDDLKQLIDLTEDSVAGSHATETKQNSSASLPAAIQKEEAGSQNLHLSNIGFVSENENSPFDNEMAKFYAEMGVSLNDSGEQNADQEKSERDASSSSNGANISIDTNTANCKQEESLDSSRTVTDSLNEEFLDNIEEMSDISGVKCQAPFITEWSGTQYHNAMIEGSATKDHTASNQDVDDIKVKVLFLNPVLQSMCPCPYYLDGSCKFEEDKCKFSHGHKVSLYELRPFIPPDYSHLEEGGSCLARFKDGVWKPGTVEKIEDDTYNIKFLHANITLPLKIEDILPQATHSDDSDLSDLDEDIVTEIIPHSADKPIDSSSDVPSSLGLWEKHTNGIGSKLMQKMGYQPGQGLGKTGQGRVEPVPIVLLPQGKSLDHCMELKLKKGIKCVDDVTNKTAKIQEAGVQEKRRRRKRTCVFSFLNKTLGDERRQVKHTAMKVAQVPKDLFGRKEGKEKKNSKMYNKEMFKNEEEMKKIQEKMNKIKKSLQRNEGNPSVLKSMNLKLKELKTTLKNMKEYDTNLKKHKTRVETHRKMTAF